MLTIGQFSRFTGLSIKTLRFYDEAGLMKPASVDRSNGYRHYSVEQLPEVHRLLALKQAMTSIADLKAAMSCNASPQRLRPMLAESKQRIEEQIANLQGQLAWINEQLASGVAAKGYAVAVKRLHPQPVVSLRSSLASYAEAEGLLETLRSRNPKLRGAFAGSIWHDCSKPSIDCEAFLLDWNRTANSQQSLEGGLVASLIHPNDPDAAVFPFLSQWVREHSYELCGPKREIELRPGLIEVQFPVKRQPASLS